MNEPVIGPEESACEPMDNLTITGAKALSCGADGDFNSAANAIAFRSGHRHENRGNRIGRDTIQRLFELRIASAPNTSASIIGAGAGDWLYGDTREDKLYGGGGRDQLWGGDDSDWLEGQNGTDSLYGGSGIDIHVLDVDHDILFGGQGTNELYAWSRYPRNPANANDLLFGVFVDPSGGLHGNDHCLDALVLGDAKGELRTPIRRRQIASSLDQELRDAGLARCPCHPVIQV